MLLLEAVASHATARATAPAVHDASGSVSWASFWHKVCAKADELIDEGVKPGDRIVLWAKPSADYLSAILACARVGAVCTPLSLMLNQRTISTLLADAGPTVILVDDPSNGACGALDGLETTASVLSIAATPGAGATRHQAAAVSKDAAMSLIYSSGTTGTPKGILHSRAARDFYGVVFALEYGITRDSVTLLATPPYSNGTWMMALPTLFQGGCCVIASQLKTPDIPDLLLSHGVTHAFLVPTQLDALFADGPRALGKSNLTIVSAGSFLPLKTKRAILDTDDVRLFELFGNTEGVCSILRPEQMEAGFDSVGTSITTGEIAVADSGEIIGRNALQSMGYFNRAELTAALWVNIDDEEQPFVRSGDLGAIGDDGFLRLKGRLKDMIVSGGINVYPADIEEFLREHEDIADAAVTGIPHQKWGETPVAYVLLKANASTDADALKAWANSQLNKHQRLQDVTILDDFPRNALGKVIKAELGDQTKEGASNA
ncbi:MAG: class I adenylate-forming enzyme family protein [Pseudomonadota bacterium]